MIKWQAILLRIYSFPPRTHERIFFYPGVASPPKWVCVWATKSAIRCGSPTRVRRRRVFAYTHRPGTMLGAQSADGGGGIVPVGHGRFAAYSQLLPGNTGITTCGLAMPAPVYRVFFGALKDTVSTPRHPLTPADAP